MLANVISGGTITASADNVSSTGVSLEAGSVVDNAVITGGTYGVVSSIGETLTIGRNDGQISTTTPKITGGDYGLYGNNFNFFAIFCVAIYYRNYRVTCENNVL